ncbi:MAG: hypothetical protein E7326_04380 [Clostridiales bacterium]|nr:hypothetical protein [Clostridiales bacterium]
MAYIRNRAECLTGCQDASPWTPKTDLQQDFIMVYGTDKDMPARILKYREKGYVTHLMTGSAWGNYQDFLDGEWDGVDHWDESQEDRFGKPIMHGERVPYLCPSMAFCKYLTEKLKPAVDTGVEAIHLEEPEFWDDGGYSEGFKREYRDFYHEEWQPPHASALNRYKCAHLKVYLYKRLLEYVSRELKRYARETYDRELKFYVPTHSLVNYTQWKILSPEGTLLDIPTVDGCIAQVWTGTSRVGNVYRGHYTERTFETAFLEYGVMQELVRGTGRRMWFLHDPVEDDPAYTWEDFRKNYLKTVVASLLHPEVHHFEAVTWPNRVMTGIYPKRPRAKIGFAPGASMTGAKPIPRDYATLICTMVQLLGDMDQKDARFDADLPRVGIFMADTGLYQRTFPDNVPHSEEGVAGLNDRFIGMKLRQIDRIDTREEEQTLFERIAKDDALYNDYVTSGPFPHFFGMAMPLIKCGIPLRPVQLENVERYEDYLQSYDTLLLSYEFIKPRSQRIHDALVSWVRSGGTLILIGDGSDPYHRAEGWWNTGELHYADPMQHLMEALGVTAGSEPSVHPAGAGRVAIYPLSPGRITLSHEETDRYLRFVLPVAAPHFAPRSHLMMHRGPYVIAACMEESVSAAPVTLRGLYADILESGFPILRQKTLQPGDNALLFDLDAIENEPLRIIGTSARIFALQDEDGKITLTCKAAADITVHIRLRLPRSVHTATATDESGSSLPVSCLWDEESRTALLTLQSTNQLTQVTLQ